MIKVLVEMQIFHINNSLKQKITLVRISQQLKNEQVIKHFDQVLIQYIYTSIISNKHKSVFIIMLSNKHLLCRYIYFCTHLNFDVLKVLYGP